MGIPESDWKRFRKLHPVALERLCKKILGEVSTVSRDNSMSFHERYGKVFGIIRDRDRDIAAAFDGPRRSQALVQLSLMVKMGLIHENELAEFTEDSRAMISRFAR